MSDGKNRRVDRFKFVRRLKSGRGTTWLPVLEKGYPDPLILRSATLQRQEIVCR